VPDALGKICVKNSSETKTFSDAPAFQKFCARQSEAAPSALDADAQVSFEGIRFAPLLSQHAADLQFQVIDLSNDGSSRLCASCTARSASVTAASHSTIPLRVANLDGRCFFALFN